MTTLILSTNNSQFVHLFENLAKVLNVALEKVTQTLSESMQKATRIDDLKGQEHRDYE